MNQERLKYLLLYDKESGIFIRNFRQESDFTRKRVWKMHNKRFAEAFGMERDLFKEMVDKMVDKGLKIPFDDVFLNKIQEVNR